MSQISLMFHHLVVMPSLTWILAADGIDSGLDFEKALDDPSMPKMSSPTQVKSISFQHSHSGGAGVRAAYHAAVIACGH